MKRFKKKNYRNSDNFFDRNTDNYIRCTMSIFF